MAQKFVDVQDGIEKQDFADVKYRACQVFLYSINALLIGIGENVSKYSEAIKRFKQYYMDTGILDLDVYEEITLVLKIHNQEAYEDENLCSNEEAIQLISKAEWFYKNVNRYIELLQKNSDNERTLEEFDLVKKIIDVADEFEHAYNAKDDDRYRIIDNAIELYEMAKNNLYFLMRYLIDGAMEAYGYCCSRLIYYNSKEMYETEELKRMNGFFLELARSDPDKWADNAADMCEYLADELPWSESYPLYRKALQLYQYLYDITEDQVYQTYIENLKFKISAI